MWPAFMSQPKHWVFLGLVVALWVGFWIGSGDFTYGGKIAVGVGALGSMFGGFGRFG